MLKSQPNSTARYLAATHASGDPLGEPAADLRDWLATAGDRPLNEIVEALQLDQVHRWRKGQRVPAETYLQLCPALRDISEFALDLIVGEFALREELGESPTRAEYLWRFPQYEAALAQQFELDEALARNARMAVPPALAGCVDSSSANGVAMASPWPRVPGYEIERELGRGAMGVVYQARQVRLNRPCALKMVLAWEQAGVDSAVRFLAEAETVARLQHPNIVQIHAYGEHGGRPYLELEYVAGGSLAERLSGTPQPPRDAARLVETLARGLDEAHRLGIVHRDLKPANILLASNGPEPLVSPASSNGARLANCIPKIADFGLAKSMQVDAGLTQTQAIMGSPSYMAPEQAEGRARDVGPPADIYALGAVFYELLTGRPPFKAPTVLATLQQVKSAEPVAPRQLQPGVPRDLDTICLKCLAKEPGRRYASARELALDLRRFLDDRPILARRVSLWERTRRWARRNRAVAASLVTIGLLLVVAALGATVEAARFRRLADEKERQRASAFRHLYLADMRVAHQDLEAGQIVRLHDLLGKYLPKSGEPDVRGWEWYYLLSL
jgi:serine/threonine protein kinase